MSNQNADTGWVRFPFEQPITIWRDDAETPGVALELALQRDEHGLTSLNLTWRTGADVLDAVRFDGRSGVAARSTTSGSLPVEVLVTMSLRQSLVGALSANAVELRRQLSQRGALTNADNWTVIAVTDVV
ncbi:MAG TPA: hypothetical protein VES40_12545 [Ilumatobacteraceae bacterium]|nr:hypothetical protein [Ilumatobacteraceae bacterium]